jgi:hydroxymethylglutaryl-CoA lyase
MGKFDQAYCFSFLEREYALMESAGIRVVEIALHDSQSFALPHEVEDDLKEIRRRWPDVRRFHFHMHNARGMALPSIYAALRSLGPEDTVFLEGTLGGIGGGQFSGNGRAAGMAPTEDLMHMLEGMGIETGVDLDKLIECVWMLERIIGRPTFGHVSKAGPRPTAPGTQYDPNMPGMESLEAAKHWKLGPGVYEKEGYFPWKAPIEGPFYRGSHK